MIFVCIDKKCSVRIAPSCIENNYKRNSHFKKYRNQSHIDDCEYATLSKLYFKDKNGKYNKSEIIKIGYPSVFNIIKEKDLKKEFTKSNLNNFDNGITALNKGSILTFEYDEQNLGLKKKQS